MHWRFPGTRAAAVADVPAVVALGLAARPVGVEPGGPQAIEAGGESHGLDDVAGTDLDTFATPDAGLKERRLGQAARRADRPALRSLSSQAVKPEAGDDRSGTTGEQAPTREGSTRRCHRVDGLLVH